MYLVKFPVEIIFRRALTISSNATVLHAEVKKIVEIGVMNGFNERTLWKWFHHVKNDKDSLHRNLQEKQIWIPIPNSGKLSRKLASVFCAFDLRPAITPPPNLQKSCVQFKHFFESEAPASGVYQVTCSCDLRYIGQTKRSLSVRIHEHLRDVKHAAHKPVSSLSKHWFDSNHSLKEVNMLHNFSTISENHIAETYYICKNKPELNSDFGFTSQNIMSCIKELLKS